MSRSPHERNVTCPSQPRRISTSRWTSGAKTAPTRAIRTGMETNALVRVTGHVTPRSIQLSAPHLMHPPSGLNCSQVPSRWTRSCEPAGTSAMTSPAVDAPASSIPGLHRSRTSQLARQRAMAQGLRDIFCPNANACLYRCVTCASSLHPGRVRIAQSTMVKPSLSMSAGTRSVVMRMIWCARMRSGALRPAPSPRRMRK